MAMYKIQRSMTIRYETVVQADNITDAKAKVLEMDLSDWDEDVSEVQEPEDWPVFLCRHD